MNLYHHTYLELPVNHAQLKQLLHLIKYNLKDSKNIMQILFPEKMTYQKKHSKLIKCNLIIKS